MQMFVIMSICAAEWCVAACRSSFSQVGHGCNDLIDLSVENLCLEVVVFISGMVSKWPQGAETNILDKIK